MDMISPNMDEIDTMLLTRKIDLAEGRERSDILSEFLMTFFIYLRSSPIRESWGDSEIRELTPKAFRKFGRTMTRSARRQA